jgi:cell pole-organizing protein PopZ
MRQDEASVEEILESIKKVIARDNRTAAFDTRRRRESEGVAEAAEEVAPEPADAEEAEEVLDLAAADFVEQAPDDHDHDYDDDEVDDIAPEPPLVTEAARVSMRENLAALAMLAEPGVPPQIVRSGETSLEGLTRDLLRPVLSEWLDRNLPEIVERLVKDEIARIAGKRG